MIKHGCLEVFCIGAGRPGAGELDVLALCTGSVGTITLRVNLRLLTLMRDTLTFQDYHGQELRLIEHFQRAFVGSLNSMTLTLDSTRARYHIRSSTAPHHTTCFALNIASSGH
ncbi:hypothetical protein M758_4G083800 [Ceratodon purpureus]|nr:hypothetical protein M758_4G083800 [Ceratodon purpureus]